MYTLGDETITVTKGGVTSTLTVPSSSTARTTDVRNPKPPYQPQSEQPQSRQVGFHTQANTTQVFIRALQQTMSVPATGVWDIATHNALAAFVRPITLGTWGQDPAKVARNATQLLTPTAEAEFQHNKRLLGLLGYPTNSFATFNNTIQPYRNDILTVLDDVEMAIRSAESVAVPMSSRVGPSPASPAEGFFAKNKVLLGVGAGVLVLSGVTLWLTRRPGRITPEQAASLAGKFAAVGIAVGGVAVATAWVVDYFRK